MGELVDRCLAVTGCDATVEVDEERMRPAGSEVGLLLCDPAASRGRCSGGDPRSASTRACAAPPPTSSGRGDTLHAAEYVV